MARVLLVDDDPAIREVLGVYLRQEGCEVLEATNGLEALQLLPQADVVILDLMLPQLTGWQVAQELRRDYPDLPLLMLTARGEEAERIQGLELGADDYVTKPFSPREVVARVRALLRRSGFKQELVFGDLILRPRQREALFKGQALNLSKLEFDLLLTLAQHPGLVWSRERLLERVWGSDFPGVDRVVDVHVAGLRKKLGEDAENPLYIETVRGVGYRFRGE
ncbi:response regulator transcription factor [Meiothermus ruber]|jgi:two-component system alkaline phosphatase synthesis response regulator PhoP|uniref:Two component transcriptional regulator, winged helix family n=1 Tax=Meiothermus ruber (strain ATCC 35948 / DSM 1279 / VKM B-1258 / 21) TaxID=504728 RepID=D3PLW9_MEIRD|nr:response regulator transcription factor [Meiothermus ruber]ADD27080.1 two component transcriptional regulator, winged helix family [Meiothermus ruber DSM 1279]AGK03534.1 winged helix family two component transcriptional regulator [Meiothermus ruber DSM 1279]MCL6530197.1 response regulator transcription factor [Meiothermus ruber]GAO74002.1 two component transcriptional regulator [Meiothermus ruber H328]